MVNAVRQLLQTILSVTRALAAPELSAMRSHAQLAAENLFLPTEARAALAGSLLAWAEVSKRLAAR